MSRRLPPVLAVALLRVTIPSGFNRDTILGDLVEEYERRVGEGVLGARMWYWRAAVQVSAAFTWAALCSVPGELARDLRFAARSFSRSPGFTVFAALTLAVGIGATTSVFTVADGLLLRPLHLPAPDRLVRVHVTEPSTGEWKDPAAAGTYLDWRAQTHSFKSLAGFRSLSFNLVGGDYPEQIQGVSVTSDFFEVLGVPAALGRTPAPQPGEESGRTVVLSHSLWKTRFGSDPTIVGQSLVLNGVSHTVLGVMPADFTFPELTALYVPSPFRVPLAPGSDDDPGEDLAAQYMSVVGRLADGVSLEVAQAEVTAVSARLAAAHPETKEGEGAAVALLKDDMVENARSTLVLLLGAVGFVLLIACANVANLLMVRATGRQPELAVRMALGAGLARVRRQLLAESVLLSFVGGVPGFLLAIWGTRTLVALAPEGIPRVGEVSVDLRVFGFAALLTLGTAMLFGLAPAVGLSDRGGGLALTSQRGRTADRRRTRLRDLVVVSEVALSLLLLVGAGLMVRTLRSLEATDPGFDATNTLVAHVALPLAKYDEPGAMEAFYETSLNRVQAIPGVESAATVLTLPMHWALRGSFHFYTEGQPSEDQTERVAGLQVASPDYFRTMRIPVLRGRVIEDTDRLETTMVAVINEALARKFWPNEDPMGRRLTFWGDPEDPETEWATVVGVVGNTRLDGLDHPPVGEVYLAQGQHSLFRSTFVVRTAGDPYSFVPALRDAIGEVDPALPLYGVSSLEDVVAQSLGERRFRMLLLVVFAGIALVLAAVGLYGVLSFSVAQRFREIGIRKALGAPSQGVVIQVVRQGYVKVLVGLSLGVVASVLMSRTLASQVYGVSTTDIVTYVGATVILGGVALLACWIPAMRAARVDPVETMRAE